MDLSTQLSEINLEIKKVESTLSDLRQKKTLIRIAIYTEQTGFRIGDEVQFMEGKELRTGRITSFRTQWSDIAPVVTFYKKDGTLGQRTKDYWYERNSLQKIVKP